VAVAGAAAPSLFSKGVAEDWLVTGTWGASTAGFAADTVAVEEYASHRKAAVLIMMPTAGAHLLDPATSGTDSRHRRRHQGEATH
jgi:hypothetical protein